VSEPSPPGGAAAATDRCPRCGGGFHCGARDEAPCPCTTVTLSPAQLQALQRRYAGCLCLACLAQIAADPSLV
jgi:hypothetical protein